MIAGCIAALPLLWLRSKAATILLAGSYAWKCLLLHGFLNGTPRMFYPFYAVAAVIAVIGWTSLWNRVRARYQQPRADWTTATS